MSVTKYKIGDEFIEKCGPWHWKIAEIRKHRLHGDDRYICIDISGRASHSPIDWVTDKNFDSWLKSGAFYRVNISPCAYCGAKMEAYKDTHVCTECYRVRE